MIDYRELNDPKNLKDSFELFARDFFKEKGFNIIQEPSRGIDGGVDLIIEELRKGPFGSTHLKWLVSCKNFSVSQKSVGVDNELNILERLLANKCDGFICFYTTIISSSLRNRIEELNKNNKIAYKIFDGRLIESELYTNSILEPVFKRYFPNSFQNFENSNIKEPLICLLDYIFKKEWFDLKFSFLKYITEDKLLIIYNTLKANSFIEFMSLFNIQVLVVELDNYPEINYKYCDFKFVYEHLNKILLVNFGIESEKEIINQDEYYNLYKHYAGHDMFGVTLLRENLFIIVISKKRLDLPEYISGYNLLESHNRDFLNFRKILKGNT